MSLEKLVNIGPITQPSAGDNLCLFLVWFIDIFNNITEFFSLRSVLLVGEIAVPEETTNLQQVIDKLVRHVKLQRT